MKALASGRSSSCCAGVKERFRARSTWRRSETVYSSTLKWIWHLYTILYAPERDDPKRGGSATNGAEIE